MIIKRSQLANAFAPHIFGIDDAAYAAIIAAIAAAAQQAQQRSQQAAQHRAAANSAQSSKQGNAATAPPPNVAGSVLGGLGQAANMAQNPDVKKTLGIGPSIPGQDTSQLTQEQKPVASQMQQNMPSLQQNPLGNQYLSGMMGQGNPGLSMQQAIKPEDLASLFQSGGFTGTF